MISASSRAFRSALLAFSSAFSYIFSFSFWKVCHSFSKSCFSCWAVSTVSAAAASLFSALFFVFSKAKIMLSTFFDSGTKFLFLFGKYAPLLLILVLVAWLFRLFLPLPLLYFQHFFSCSPKRQSCSPHISSQVPNSFWHV